MKRSILFMLGLVLSTLLCAQTPGAAEKNAANNAVRAKNFSEAFTQYEKYLGIVNNEDKASVYNAAFCAFKIKNYAAAAKYYELSTKANYKAGSAYLGWAKALQAQKKTDEMVALLETALKARPTDSKLATMYASHFLKSGQALQKKGQISAAVENYKKITGMANKNFKAMGFLSLATLYFNNGATIMEKANPFANTDKAKFDAEKAKAFAQFKLAQENVMQAKANNPTSPEATALAAQITEAMK